MGESPRLTAIAELLEEAIQREQGRGTVLEARKNIYIVDKQVRRHMRYMQYSDTGGMQTVQDGTAEAAASLPGGSAYSQ